MDRRWKVLGVTAVAVFMGFLDVTIVNVAFPDIERDFAESTRADLSWVLNAYNIVFAALLVPAGRLADLFGRRRMFLIGVVAFLGTSLLCGLAPSAELLVAARILQAAAGAILVPTSLALLLPEFPVRQARHRRGDLERHGRRRGRARPVARRPAGGCGGLALGVLRERANRPARAHSSAPGAARDARPRRPSPGCARQRAAGRGRRCAGARDRQGLGLGLGQPARAWGARRRGVLLPAVVLRSARHRAPVIDLSLFRSRSFAVANVGMFAFSTAFYALLLANVLFLTQVWGYSILEAGFAVTPGPLMAALSAPIAGRLADRFGQRVVALPGALLFAMGCLLFATGIGASPNYVSEYLGPTMLTGMGVGFSFAAWGSAAVADLPGTRFATGSAVLACLRQIGAVLGIAGPGCGA